MQKPTCIELTWLLSRVWTAVFEEPQPILNEVCFTKSKLISIQKTKPSVLKLKYVAL